MRRILLSLGAVSVFAVTGVPGGIAAADATGAPLCEAPQLKVVADVAIVETDTQVVKADVVSLNESIATLKVDATEVQFAHATVKSAKEALKALVAGKGATQPEIEHAEIVVLNAQFNLSKLLHLRAKDTAIEAAIAAQLKQAKELLATDYKQLKADELALNACLTA